jgi:hypothetical protein
MKDVAFKLMFDSPNHKNTVASSLGIGGGGAVLKLTCLGMLLRKLIPRYNVLYVHT